MKMKKIFAGALACATLLSGVSAFAAEVSNDTYKDDGNTVSVKTDLSSYAGKQMTVIVIPASAYGKSTIEDGDILYIDQDEASATGKIFQDMGILGTSLTAGDYYIKIGGQDIAKDDIIVEKFTVGSSTPSYTYGDVDGYSGVTAKDATTILQYCAGMVSLSDDLKIAADVDGYSGITAKDATTVLQYCAGMVTSLPIIAE